eukprot:1326405-Amorphochlora_amoeboformis.AAC.1
MTTRCADFRFATALVVTLALAFIAASITVSKTSTSGVFAKPLAAPLPRAHRCATARARVGAAPLGKKQAFTLEAFRLPLLKKGLYVSAGGSTGCCGCQKGAKGPDE